MVNLHYVFVQIANEWVFKSTSTCFYVTIHAKNEWETRKGKSKYFNHLKILWSFMWKINQIFLRAKVGVIVIHVKSEWKKLLRTKVGVLTIQITYFKN